MKIIVNGKIYDADWCWPMESDTILVFQIKDTRPLHEIAQEFERAIRIEKISAEEGNAEYLNNGRVLRVLRPDAKKQEVQLAVERGEKL